MESSTRERDEGNRVMIVGAGSRGFTRFMRCLSSIIIRREASYRAHSWKNRQIILERRNYAFLVKCVFKIYSYLSFLNIIYLLYIHRVVESTSAVGPQDLYSLLM